MKICKRGWIEPLPIEESIQIKQKTREASLEFRTTCEPDNRRFEKILFELMVLSQMVVNHSSNPIIAHNKEMSMLWAKNIISDLI